MDQDSAESTIKVSHKVKDRVRLLAAISELTEQELVELAVLYYINRHRAELEAQMRRACDLLGIQPARRVQYGNGAIEELEVRAWVRNKLKRAGAKSIADVAAAHRARAPQPSKFRREGGGGG